jgi:hypothetical protein
LSQIALLLFVEALVCWHVWGSITMEVAAIYRTSLIAVKPCAITAKRD